MLGRACLFLSILLILAHVNRAPPVVYPGYMSTEWAFDCHDDWLRDCPDDHYNACNDDNLWRCRPCGMGWFTSYDVQWPIAEDCRLCPSWTRDVVNMDGNTMQHTYCTAECARAHASDVLGDHGRVDQCHRLPGPDRQCTTCPNGKYRIRTTPPVTTSNAVQRANFIHHYECALCPGNAVFGGDGLGSVQPCDAARCVECPVNCASEIWLGPGLCQATSTDFGTFYGIAQADKTSCFPCRSMDSETPKFQWVPPSGTPECLTCAAGRELAAQQDFVAESNPYKYKECRVTTSAAELRWVAGVGYDADECCHMCKVNTYRPYNHPGPCEYCPGDETARDVDNTQVPRGGVSCAPCSRGFKLLYCKMLSGVDGGPGQCLEFDLGSPAEYWRVCVPCDNNEYFLSTENGGCARCDPFAREGSPARGDRRSADDSRCEFCSACDTSIVDKLAQTLLEWTELSASRLYQAQTCQPLQGRTLRTDPHALSFVTEGFDMYKPTPASAPAPVPPFHTLPDTGQSSCNLRHCAEACTDFFMYAAGCGPQESDPFVRNATNYLRLSQLNDVVTLTSANIYGATAGWQLAPEGRCDLCTECSDGEYNSACGAASVFALGLAAGVCTTCDIACADSTTDATVLSYWKDHPRGTLGCSWPADLTTTALSGHGLPQAPYTCRICPRWIQRAVIGQTYYEMYTPEACGNTLRYHTWGFAVPCDGADCDCALDNTDNALAGPLRTVTRCVRSLAEHQADPLADAVVVDSFRRHLVHGTASAPRPYCPPHYYFDTNICGQFTAQSEPCAFNSADMCGFERDYSHTCCTRCAVCDVAEGRRNGPNYRDCSGATSIDTQAGDGFANCVSGDACPTNYFRSSDSAGAASCEACSTCTAGEL